jgi:hypothetical protein
MSKRMDREWKSAERGTCEHAGNFAASLGFEALWVVQTTCFARKPSASPPPRRTARREILS